MVLTRLGRELVRFLCQPGVVPSLRTVIAIADRMPELGAKFYLAGPGRGIALLKAYLEDQVAAGALKPYNCEIAAAQFIESCLSLTYKPMLFNFDGPPGDARIDSVVEMAVFSSGNYACLAEFRVATLDSIVHAKVGVAVRCLCQADDQIGPIVRLHALVGVAVNAAER